MLYDILVVGKHVRVGETRKGAAENTGKYTAAAVGIQ